MKALCALLLIVMGVNFLSVLPRKSITVDDIVHIPAGFYHLHGNFRINFEQPPLAQMLSALPFLFMHAQAPPVERSVGSIDPARGFTQNSAAQEFWRANNERYEQFPVLSPVPKSAL